MVSKSAKLALLLSCFMVVFIKTAVISDYKSVVLPSIGTCSKSLNEFCSVNLGYPVSYSSYYISDNLNNFKLDSPTSWSALYCQSNEWIQVTSIIPQNWTAVVTQGRANAAQWVT
jgi:hypothetical protein